MESAEKANGILQAYAGIESIHRDELTLNCILKDGVKFPLPDLVSAQVTIEEMKKTTRSLEDVYLDIIKEGETE